MSFFNRFSRIFTPAKPYKAPDFSTSITVKCNRCGEMIHARIDLRNDLTIDYGENTSQVSYYTRKVLIGENRCYQQIEVKLFFDRNRKIINRQISGGLFVDEI